MVIKKMISILMATAVSFDDVWQDNMIMSTKQPVKVATEVSKKPELAHRKSAKIAYVHRKKSVKFIDDVETDSSSSETEDTDVEEKATTVQLSKLLKEIKELREESLQQQSVNLTILYTSVAIVIILLVMLYHTSQKLHYTTDVLLWHLKSRGTSP